MRGSPVRPVTSLIRSSLDDWDSYVSDRALAFLDWLDEQPGHPDTEQVREWRRDHSRDLGREYVGWALFAGRKTRYA